MALINCPECNKQISDKAVNCPYCGYPLSLSDTQSQENYVSKAGTVQTNTEPVKPVEPTQTAESAESTEINKNTDESSKKNTNSLLSKRLRLFNKDIPLIAVLGSILVVLIIILIIILIPKSSTPNKKETDNIAPSQSSATESPTVAEKKTEPPVKEIKYIGDRTVQYNEQDDDYIVFFALKDENEERMSAPGTAIIVISDNTGNELYNNRIHFTESDFTTWNNKFDDTQRYLCGLHIKNSDIAGAASSSGVLALAVELDNGITFESYNINILNLKEKEVEIQIPQLPQTITNYTYSNEIKMVVEVTDVKTQTRVNYDGTASLTVNLTVKMLENYTDSSTSYSQVGYKLKDSNGVIVDSGNAYINPMAVGETATDQVYINKLSANESYVLEFENPK